MDSSQINFDKIKKYLLAIIKILCWSFCVICILCGGIPLIFYGHINPGNISLLIYAMLLLVLLLVKTCYFKNKKHQKIIAVLKRIIAIFLVVCFVTGFFVSMFMIKYAFFNEPDDESGDNGTIVVLGCKNNGNEPSTTLKGRLDAAYEYLKKHEYSAAIVSGGKNWDEEVSEAYVMKKYLVDKGIEESRIFIEDKSTNTDENIKFSGKIIEENNLPNTMYIITDTFHSYRSFLFAEKNGYEVKNISADIYWPWIGEYWVRDILGILHMKLTPNWELDIQNS